MTDHFADTLAIAVETSGRRGCVAIGRGDKVVAVREFPTDSNHGAELLPSADALCTECGIKPADLQQVYVSGGPGSFTGLRVGITFAKAMALATGARVVRVPTLEVVAQNALTLEVVPERVTVMLDAKRGRAYCATFARAGDSYRGMDEAAERSPAEYVGAQSPTAVLGEGVAYHLAALQSLERVTLLPESIYSARAEVVHRLGRALALQGRFVDASDLTPIYIRRPEAEEKWEKRRAGAQGSAKMPGQA